MLNEFCLNTGYHRKYAIRLLNGPPPGKQPERRPRGRRPRYGRQVLSILAGIWEAAGYPWSVRLKALLPNWMPWIRPRYSMSSQMEKQLLRISARQIDRRLKAKKSERKRRIYGRTQPGALLKHHIPVKTDSWDVKAPGFTEIDLVSHSGNSGEGEFAHSLNLTDIHSGWTESRALLGRSQVAVPQAPWERLLASGHADPAQVAELKKLVQSLDPFQLGKVIDQKLERIYELAHRRLSPRAAASPTVQAAKKVLPSRRNGWGKHGGGAALENASRFPVSHSRDGSRPPGTFQMSRRTIPGLHSQMA